MTDADFTFSQTPGRRRRKWALTAIVVVLVLVLAVVGIWSGGYDQKLVKGQVDGFIASAKEGARNRGRGLDITYGSIEMKGGLLGRHAIVHDVALKVQPLERQPLAPGEMRKPDTVLVTTPEVALYPKSADMRSLRIDLPQPVNFAGAEQPEKSLMKITTDKPFSVEVSPNMAAKQASTFVTYAIPAQIDFTYLREEQAKGTEDATPELESVYETIRMTTAPGAKIESNLANDGSHLGTAVIAIDKVTLTPQGAPEGSATIDTIRADWNSDLNEQGQNSIKSTVAVGPISAPAELLPLAPVEFHFDATYLGIAPQTTAPTAGATPPEASVALKTFRLTTKDAAINATATFNSSPSDVLPVGAANIAVTNVPFILGQLRSYRVIDPAREEMIDVALQLITGTPPAELKDATIAIERGRGGSFKVGKTTFEELFATFLKMAMKPREEAPDGAEAPALPAPNSKAPAVAPVPQLPEAGKPKAAPQPIHDPSVRG